jgi:exosortase
MDLNLGGIMARARLVAAVVGLAALVAFLYHPVIAGLTAQWSTDTTFGYGYTIPPVAAYLAWERRHRLRVDSQGTWWGYALLIAGLLALLIGRAGGIQLLARISLVPILFGLVMFLGGRSLTRELAFPIAFLAVMIPPPVEVFYRLTWPLQIFTAKFSTEVLRFVGYPVLLQGIYIDLPTVRLEVAAACSGFRSIVSLGATALLVAFTFQTRWVNRALLLASVLPIAILANSVRVTSNILLGMYEGTYHLVSGWLVFIMSLAALLIVGMILNRWNAPRSLA